MIAHEPGGSPTFAITLVRGRVDARLDGAPLPGLDGCPVEDLPHVAASLAEGRVYRFAAPDGRRWLVDPHPPEEPDLAKAWRAGLPAIHRVPGRILRLATEAALRLALAPWEGQVDGPPWLATARRAHVALLAALGGRRLDAAQ